jgi:hypothetical protein
MAVKKIDAMQTAQIIALQTDVGELRTKLNKAVTDALAISTILNILINDLNDMNDVVMKGYTSPASPESYGILEAIDIFQLGFDEHKGVRTYIAAGNTTVLGTFNPAFQPFPVPPQSPYYLNGVWLCAPAPAFATHACANLGWLSHTTAHTLAPNSSRGHGLTALGQVNIPTSTQRFSPPPGGVGQNSTPPASGGNTGNNAPNSNLAPVLDGTDQGTNSSHSADAANAITKNEYDNRERLLEAPKAINRARKLVRNTLNKLRSK